MIWFYLSPRNIILPFMTSIMLGICKSLFVLGLGGIPWELKSIREKGKCRKEMKREGTEENCHFDFLVSFKKGMEKKMAITY